MWRLVCVSVFLVHCIVALKLSSVTSHVKLSGVRGTVSGFVDFNADKTTDILVQTGIALASPSYHPLLLLDVCVCR